MPYLKLAALPLGLAVAALSACSFEAGPTVSGEALAEAAEDAVESESGERPDIDCGDDDIIASQDKEVDCVASDPATGAEYDAVVTFTGVDGDTWNIAVEMRTDEESTAQPAEETGAPAEDSGEQAGSGEAIPAASIAEAAADALEAEVGSRPDIDCGDVDIVPENGRTVYCTLTDPADGAEYETTVTFTGVEGDTWSVDVSVASEPK